MRGESPQGLHGEGSLLAAQWSDSRSSHSPCEWPFGRRQDVTLDVFRTRTKALDAIMDSLLSQPPPRSGVLGTFMEINDSLDLSDSTRDRQPQDVTPVDNIQLGRNRSPITQRVKLSSWISALSIGKPVLPPSAAYRQRVHLHSHTILLLPVSLFVASEDKCFAQSQRPVRGMLECLVPLRSR